MVWVAYLVYSRQKNERKIENFALGDNYFFQTIKVDVYEICAKNKNNRKSGFGDLIPSLNDHH
jgi:hypothetical protein